VPADGCVITLETNPQYAEVAAQNIASAGFTKIVDIQNGNAIETLNQFIQSRMAPFDLIFIDADKPSNPDYLKASLQLSRPGTIIIWSNFYMHYLSL
jgi:predicted O-methyltransferase YrrM